MEYLSLGLLFLIALFCGAAVLSVVIAIRAGREHRNTIFPIVREVEGDKARRARIALIVFLVLSAVSAGAWVATQQRPENILIASTAAAPIRAVREAASTDAVLSVLSEVNNPPAPIDTPIVPPRQEENGSPVVLVQPTPTFVVSVPTGTATPTLTQPSRPADETAPPAILAETATPIPPVTPTETAGLQPAPPGAQIGPIVFATEITNQREAVNPARNFSANAGRIYAVFPYHGMRDGLPFSIVWFYQGQELLRDDSEWQWGSEDQSYTFIIPRGAGDYMIELKIGSETLASGSFEVLP
jgi:hypothetical protein